MPSAVPPRAGVPWPARGARLLPLLLPAALVLASVGRADPPARTRPALEVQGHRGARARFSENTLAAFAHAVQVGADVLELDLVVTADDQLVILHDPVLPPGTCAGQTAPLIVRSETLAQLRKRRCRPLHDAARFPLQKRVAPGPIPTLDDLFRYLAGLDGPAAARVRFNIETKLVPGRPELAPEPEAFAHLVIERLRAQGMLGRATLQSFDHRVLVAAHQEAPELGRVALLAESRPDHVAVATAAHAGVVSPPFEWITLEDVEAIHAAGLRVIPWTVNRPADWDRMIALGVDGIITDDPEALLGHLRKRGLR